MSSGFVSGGTADAPIERDSEWLAAQKELEANRLRKAREASQSDGKGLYETLQANKAAKEEAFAEAAKLKHQFRSLDEDEIEFLDSVLESTRAEEARVKKETNEGLAAFRRQQDEADKKAREALREGGNEISVVEEDTWTAPAGKKRKRPEREGLKGVKLRKASTSEAENNVTKEEGVPKPVQVAPETTKVSSSITNVDKSSDQQRDDQSKSTVLASQPTKKLSSLVMYASDSDDD